MGGGDEESRKLVRERPVKGRKCMFVYVRGVSEEQWPSQGAVIRARPSCRLAPSPYAIFKQHALVHSLTHKHTDSLTQLEVPPSLCTMFTPSRCVCVLMYALEHLPVRVA